MKSLVRKKAPKETGFYFRQSEREHLEYERLAAERGLTVSDLIRESVHAYTSGEAGTLFLKSCSRRETHHPGLRCVMCGGVR